MTYEILGLFVITLAAGDKYSLHNRENLPQPIQMQLPAKEEVFSQYFPLFFKSTSNLKDFEKKINLIAYIFPKL